MKKLLALSFAVLFALSGVAFANNVGHTVGHVGGWFVQVVGLADVPDGVGDLDLGNIITSDDVTGPADAAGVRYAKDGLGFTQTSRTAVFPSKEGLAGPNVFAVNGSDLHAVFGIGADETLDVNNLFLINDKGGSFSEVDFTILNSEGEPVTSISADGVYLIQKDLPEDGEFQSALVHDPDRDSGRSGGSGGCNAAGLPLLSGILALSALLFIKRK